MKTKEYVSEDENLTLYFRDPEMTVRHRERGLPAWKWSDGKSYWENDRYHRLNGLAFDWSLNKHHLNKYYFLNGKRLFCKVSQEMRRRIS